MLADIRVAFFKHDTRTGYHAFDVELHTSARRPGPPYSWRTCFSAAKMQIVWPCGLVNNLMPRALLLLASPGALLVQIDYYRE